jgi:redox-sensitive bicupin YhaK (pirin superfamily)
MGRARAVRAAAQLVESRMSAAFTSYGLRGLPGFSLDPFLNLDDFRMSEPTFPPHPHAGFSAVTYLFEDSPGAFINRDSLGDRSRIGPGSLHWTQAARGMMHEEIPEVRGVVSHGLQMFVNLSAEHKQAAPRAFHVDASAVPELLPGEGGRVRVLVGALAGVASPLTELLTPILLLDVQLKPSATVVLPVGEPTCFVLTLSGSGATQAGGARTEIVAHQALGFDREGDQVELEAGESGLHLLLAAGTPIGEPVVFGGPFAMTTRAELEAANARYQRGEMGRLARSEGWR